MKKKIYIIGLYILMFTSINSQVNNSKNLIVIDIEKGIKELTNLKVSDFGKSVRFIPLETTNESLIGNNPTVSVTNDYIVVGFRDNCLLFDKKDGKFISKIGHLGQDNQDFLDSHFWLDEKGDFLYFIGNQSGLIKYEIKGKFVGNVNISFSQGLPNTFLITDSNIIGFYYDINFNPNNKYSLVFFDKNGVSQNYIPSIFGDKKIEYNNDIFLIPHSKVYGNWTKQDAHILRTLDSKRIIASNNLNSFLWKHKDNIRFKEEFTDTIYNVADGKTIPSIVFHTGKYHWPRFEMNRNFDTNARVFVSYVSENDNFIFFQCIRGLLTKEPILYNGLYNKKTGETKFGNTIQDDLTGFMPFTPETISSSGEFVSIIDIFDLNEWLEKHPEAKNNDKLTFLKNYEYDMNPIIMLVY